MTRITTKLFVAAFGFGLSFIGATISQACDGGGGGGYRPVYRPRTTSCYSDPYASQQYGLPPQGYPQSQYGNGQYQGQYQGNQYQPTSGQYAGGQFQPQGGQVQQGGQPQGGQVQQGGQFQQGQVQQGGQFQQGVQGGQPQQAGVTGTKRTSFAGSKLPSNGQAAPARTVARRVSTTGSNVSVQPQQVAAAQQPQTPASTAPTGGEEAAMSALEALGGWDGSEPAEQATQAGQAELGHVGNWKATLANGVTIELALAANGSFRWNALNNGKTSTFQGSYTFENGSLTLIRSDNNQQLGGSITNETGNAFNFKLSDAKDAGLEFARS